MDLAVDITGIKRGLAREKVVQGRAYGVDVVEMCGAFAVELLRTHINQRPAPALFHGQPADRITQTARDPKVGDLQLAPLIHHQVRRLEIAMNDLRVIVRVIESVTELTSPGPDLIWLKNLPFFLCAQIRKGFAVDVFHRDASRAFVVHEVVNAHNVLMSQLETALRLPLQLIEQSAIVHDQIGKKFQRDFTLQFLIAR